MNHPETCAGRLAFNAADPYERYAYEQTLGILLDSAENDPTVPARVHDQEEKNKMLLGGVRAGLITAQAVLDEMDIRSPESMPLS